MGNIGFQQFGSLGGIAYQPQGYSVEQFYRMLQMQTTTGNYSSAMLHNVDYRLPAFDRTPATPNLDWLDKRVNEMRVRL